MLLSQTYAKQYVCVPKEPARVRRHAGKKRDTAMPRKGWRDIIQKMILWPPALKAEDKKIADTSPALVSAGSRHRQGTPGLGGLRGLARLSPPSRDRPSPACRQRPGAPCCLLPLLSPPGQATSGPERFPSQPHLSKEPTTGGWVSPLFVNLTVHKYWM